MADAVLAELGWDDAPTKEYHQIGELGRSGVYAHGIIWCDYEIDQPSLGSYYKLIRADGSP